MVVAIAGHSGFIGSYLKKHFQDQDHEVILINKENFYDKTTTLKDQILRADIIINLAGKNIFTRWNKKNKKKILDSRVFTTRRIVDILNHHNHTEKLYINASAIGIYKEGEHNEEDFQYDHDFLAQVVTQWEREVDNLNHKQIRKVILRFGVVIGKSGGILKKNLPLFKAGLGTILGSGRQVMSVIALKEIGNIIDFIIQHKNSQGVYNATMPFFCTYEDFAVTLAKHVKRPLWFRIPSFILKMGLGEMAGMILKSQKIYPGRLLKEGFQFSYHSLENIIKDN